MKPGTYNLPPGWRRVKLGSVCQLYGEGTPSRKIDRYFSGSIPWATPTDVTALKRLEISDTATTISEKAIEESSTRLLPPGCVLLTSRATIGFTAINTVPMCTNQGLANLECGPQVLNYYLAYCLPHIREILLNLAGGSIYKEISKSTLKELEIPLPSLPVQERIVQILQKADEIRRKRKEALELADAILPAIFHEMFGDPTSNPKGYERTTIGAVTSLVTSGYTPRGGARNYVEDGSLLIRSQNVRMLHLDLNDCAHIPEAIHEEMARVRVMPGDVLLNITGASIGRVAWAGDDVPPANVNQHVCIIRAKKELVAPEYLGFCLATPWYQHIILTPRALPKQDSTTPASEPWKSWYRRCPYRRHYICGP